MDKPATRSRPSDAAHQRAREVLASLGSPDTQNPFGTHIWDDAASAAVANVLSDHPHLIERAVICSEGMLDNLMSGVRGFRRLDEGDGTGKGILGRRLRMAVRADHALIPLALRWEAAHRAWASPHHRVLPGHAWRDHCTSSLVRSSQLHHPGTKDPTPTVVPIIDQSTIAEAWAVCSPSDRSRIMTSCIRWLIDGDMGGGAFLSACVGDT